MPGEDNGKCLVCEGGEIQHPCKLCRAYLYCSKGCSKRDTKKHKPNCSDLGLILTQKKKWQDGELASTETWRLFQKHMCYLGAKVKAKEEDRAESKASARSVLSGAGLAAKAKKSKNDQRARQDAISAASKDFAAALRAHDQALAEKAAAGSAVAGARGGLAWAEKEARNLKPESYGDSEYWERRHAKSRECDDTYEWYTGYPKEALREAFPQSVRDKKMLVVGCGNSELSEKMCTDGFRDVLSIDTSESAIKQMSARAPQFNTAQTSCRYEVMDAGRLDALGADTFGGVVDKGTIDAVLTGGLEPARRICREAMRVLEPGGTFLVISNTPAEKLRAPLLDMCGPGSTANSPSTTIPAAADACVYAHFIRKNSSAGEGGSVVSAPGGEAHGVGAEHLGPSNASGASAAGEGTARLAAAAAAPGSDSQVSELQVPVEPRKPSDCDGGCDDGDHPGSIGETGGLPSSEALLQHEPTRDGLVQEEGGLRETERNRELRSLKKKVFADVGADVAQLSESHEEETLPTPQVGETPLTSILEALGISNVTTNQLAAEVAGGKSLPWTQDDEDFVKSLRELREAETNRPPAAGRAPLPSPLTHEGILKALGFPISGEKPNKEFEKILEEKKARSRAGGVSSSPPPVAAVDSRPSEQGRRQQQHQQQQQQQPSQQQQDPPPVMPAQQPSLPWGSQESFSEDDAGVAITYELKLDTELSASRLSVDIGTSRVKASYRRKPGDRNCEVLLDRELHDKVTAESTWCIEDKKILTLILSKRTPLIWGRVFKSAAEPPPVIRRGGTAQTNANGSGTRAVGSSPPRQEAFPAATGGRPSKPAPVPSPPAVPRKHEQSPKAGLVAVAARDFKPPERFLVEDHVGIKKLQLHLSKPQGFSVTGFHVARPGPDPELCEVRFVCRDSTGSGLPDAHFLQRANVGRADFSAELASCAGEAADGLCVVGVPYGTGDRGEVDRAGRFDADDEGLRRVARLRCRFCRHHFTPAGPGSGSAPGLVVKAMPSGRFDECIEDMICYDGPRAVPALARDVNFARPGSCLMLQGEVLLHPRDVAEGAVAVVDSPASSSSGKGSGVPPVEEEPGEGLGWRSLECARCDLPLGRLATLPDGLRGHGEGESGGLAEEEEEKEKERGLLLLKHCLLGDDVSDHVGDEDDDGDDGNGDDDIDDDAPRDGGDGAGEDARAKGEDAGSASSGLAGKAGHSRTSPARRRLAPPCVFRNRTAIKWLMGEMSHFSDRDGCARFILSARGRSPAAPGGALTLVLVKMDGLVSTSGGSKPRRAHRVAFREESRQEAERRDEEERRDGALGLGSPPKEVGAAAGGGGGVGDSGGGEEGTATAAASRKPKTAAKVPARVLEVSYAEYGAVRERLLDTAWAGASSKRLDPRGFTFSYLF